MFECQLCARRPAERLACSVVSLNPLAGRPVLSVMSVGVSLLLVGTWKLKGLTGRTLDTLGRLVILCPQLLLGKEEASCGFRPWLYRQTGFVPPQEDSDLCRETG